MSDRQRFIRSVSILAVILVWMILYSTSAFAQEDKYGKPDTCRIVVIQDEKDDYAVAHVSIFNDEELAAMTLPFSYGDGKSPVSCDSIRFYNTRSQFFDMRTELIDTVRQVVLIGLVAEMGGSGSYMKKGNGDVARIYFTLPKDKKFQDFRMDSTWAKPMNHLKFVTPDVEGLYPVFDNSRAVIIGGIPIPPPKQPTEKKEAEKTSGDKTEEKK